MEYYGALKKEWRTDRCYNLEISIVSERNHTQKTTYVMI